MKVTYQEKEKPNLTLKDLWYGNVFRYKTEEENEEEDAILILISPPSTEQRKLFHMVDLETGSYFYEDNGDQPVERLDAEVIVHKD